MNKSTGVRALILFAAFVQFFFTPAAFAQLVKVKTSYSALTANMAAYWLAKEAKILKNTV